MKIDCAWMDFNMRITIIYFKVVFGGIVFTFNKKTCFDDSIIKFKIDYKLGKSC